MPIDDFLNWLDGRKLPAMIGQAALQLLFASGDEGANFGGRLLPGTFDDISALKTFPVVRQGNRAGARRQTIASRFPAITAFRRYRIGRFGPVPACKPAVLTLRPVIAFVLVPDGFQSRIIGGSIVVDRAGIDDDRCGFSHGSKLSAHRNSSDT
ncbi:MULTISPECIES: hypothetical protein [unclassified Mesorhizobium]|uniref:hypothetical protein n=1 Tax=unclassified Mesorhizobium TaxID=325217 RepID=UPI0013E36FD8|nr:MULTISPECIES: hypothetical protein [unclassified Mesorhizobium]MCF6124392.1 hypothetical protein [Mesorhizobium ciceri]MCQ8816647.1 hypothetical protein [Mesorhizobium sp. SEMIA396]